MHLMFLELRPLPMTMPLCFACNANGLEHICTCRLHKPFMFHPLCVPEDRTGSQAQRISKYNILFRVFDKAVALIAAAAF